MEHKKYKILVLSDLKGNTSNILKNTVSLAKMIDGEIEFFHVKKPTEIVENDNQLSAMRSINSEFSSTNKKLNQMVESFSKEFDSEITFNFSFGNVKEKIGEYIEQYQPDIIVLGKRKSNPLKLIGDQITQFVLNQYKGVVMIASNDHVLEPNTNVSLGVLDDVEKALQIDFAESLLDNSKGPLKSFRVVEKATSLEERSTNSNQNVVEYVFEKSDNTIKTLSHYLSKNNINLLCVNRENNLAINKLNVSLLVAN